MRSHTVRGLALAAAVLAGAAVPTACSSGKSSSTNGGGVTTAKPGGSSTVTVASPDSGSTGRASGAVDGCSLLTTDEVARVVPQPGVVARGDAIHIACKWAGAGDGPHLTIDGGQSSLAEAFVHGDSSRLPAALHLRKIPGIGDAATVWSVRQTAVLTFAKHGYLFHLSYTGADPEQHVDTLISLGKIAAGRIG